MHARVRMHACVCMYACMRAYVCVRACKRALGAAHACMRGEIPSGDTIWPQGLKPRKGVLRALGQALQRPLAIDHHAATLYTELAAERGVVSAMAVRYYACFPMHAPLRRVTGR